MKSYTAIALSALLGAASAIPMHEAHGNMHAALHHKRAQVWVTETAIAVTTEVVYTTIYGDAPAETPVNKAYNQHHGGQNVQPQPAATTAAVSSASVAPVQPAASPETVASPAAPAASSVEDSAPVESAAPVTQTSAYVAPTTTSASVDAEPTTIAAASSTYAAASTYATPSATAAAVSSGSVNPQVGAVNSGDATTYTAGGGACNFGENDSGNFVALSMGFFDQYTPGGNPNNNRLCGVTIDVTGPSGTVLQAKIVDRCVGCKGGDLDMSLGLFEALFDGATTGRMFDTKWSFAEAIPS